MAYEPIQNPKWSERDALPKGDKRKIIKAADFDTEFNGIKSEFDRINRHGIVASCKYNGSALMYQEGITSVANGWNGDDGLSPGAYKVTFNSEIEGFDEHYAPIITAFPAIVDGSPAFPCVVALQGFYADAVVFTVHQIGGDENGAASENPVGFSLLIVDMESSI